MFSKKINPDEQERGIIFSNRNPYGKARQKVLNCFSRQDYSTLENYLNMLSLNQLQRLFDEEGYAILTSSVTKMSASPIKFIAERVPTEISQAALRKDDFRVVREYIDTQGSLEITGDTDEVQKQLRCEIFETFLKIDKEGVTDLIFGDPENHHEMEYMTFSIKEDFSAILNKMDNSLKMK